MTGTLALVGGEPFGSACTFNESLLRAAGTHEVVLLPTAAAFENPDHQVTLATAYFDALGVTTRPARVLSRSDAMDDANAGVVRDATVIYLIGSSSMHARPTLTQTAVWDALVAAWEAGATVIGSDGGADILCDPMIDERGGAFTVGLGLIERLTVVTHYDTLSDEARHRLRELASPDVAVVGVDEATAAVRSPDGSWRAEGAGQVEVHLGSGLGDLGDLTR